MTNEIMLLGVASLLLLMVQKNVAGLCCESLSFWVLAFFFFFFFFSSEISELKTARGGLNKKKQKISLSLSPKQKTTPLTTQSRRRGLQAPHLARLGRRLRLLPLPHRGGLQLLFESQGLRRRQGDGGLLRSARGQWKDLRQPQLLRGASGSGGPVGCCSCGDGARRKRGERAFRSPPAPEEPSGFRGRRSDSGDSRGSRSRGRRELRGESRARHRRVPPGEEARGERHGAARGPR